jgi:hypothetical protein
MNELNDKQINFLLNILKGVEVRGTREQVGKVSAEIEGIEVILRDTLLSRQAEVLARKLPSTDEVVAHVAEIAKAEREL